MPTADQTCGKGLKLALSGKGGVGKTTLAAFLARAAVKRGYRVVVVDADPNPTLAATLGCTRPIKSLLENADLIEERVGSGGLIRLDPKVDDLLPRFGVEHDGLIILVLGGIRGGAQGCACPASVLLRAVLRHLVLAGGDMVIVDLEAGVEHLGRATAQGVDALLIVVEPDKRSLDTAKRIFSLAKEVGISRVYAVGNKIKTEMDVELVRVGLPEEVELLGFLWFSAQLEEAARRGRAVGEAQEADKILSELERRLLVS